MKIVKLGVLGYLCAMFVRKKPNKSGAISVQIVQKTKTRKQRVVKSFGSARPDDTATMEKLMRAASSFLPKMAEPTLPPIYEEKDVIDSFVGGLNNAQSRYRLRTQSWCSARSTTASATAPYGTACSAIWSSNTYSIQAAS